MYDTNDFHMKKSFGWMKFAFCMSEHLNDAIATISLFSNEGIDVYKHISRKQER